MIYHLCVFMKKYSYSHHTGLFLLRLLLATVFMFHFLPKLAATEQMVAFIGGAPHMLGLQFLSASVWFYLAVVGELFVVITALLWILTRMWSIVLFVVMFFAMVAKKWAFPAIEIDLLLMGIWLVLFVAWPWKYSLSKHHRIGHDHAKVEERVVKEITP